MEDPIIQEIRDGFDELFLGSSTEITAKSRELFKTLGIEGFADIVARNKKYGFSVSQKILADLVKVSFIVYSNIDNFPIKRKTILPPQSGSYKFIVTSLPHPMLRGDIMDDLKDEGTNTIFLVSTGDDMHSKIAEKSGLKSKYHGEVAILGGAWIDIDYEKKTFCIHDDSGSYGSCSNQIVERMLEDYVQQGYEIKISMKDQREFFGK